MLDSFLLLLYLGFATSAISVTLTRAGITKDLRLWFMGISPFFKALLGCPYCTSHWVAGVIVIIYRPTTHHVHLFVEMLVSIMATVGVAAVVTGVVISTIPSLGEKQ
jgi:hypothetical protein